uniref:Ovule protein n=1 Tax=Strongyloides venezuelensis TaxID=75913 RepID=A0A0K0G5B1_STRVS
MKSTSTLILQYFLLRFNIFLGFFIDSKEKSMKIRDGSFLWNPKLLFKDMLQQRKENNHRDLQKTVDHDVSTNTSMTNICDVGIGSGILDNQQT